MAILKLSTKGNSIHFSGNALTDCYLDSRFNTYLTHTTRYASSSEPYVTK